MHIMQENRILPLIAQAIRKGCAAQGMSQKQLAEFMCVDTSMVSKWENGKTVPTGDSLIKLATKLKIVELLFPEYNFDNDYNWTDWRELAKDVEKLKLSNKNLEENIRILLCKAILGITNKPVKT